MKQTTQTPQKKWSDDIQKILPLQTLDATIVCLTQAKERHIASLMSIEHQHNTLCMDLHNQTDILHNIKEKINTLEHELELAVVSIKKLSKYQESVKKASEYNEVYQKILAAQKNKQITEDNISKLIDEKIAVEDTLTNIRSNMESSTKTDLSFIRTLINRIKEINTEAQETKSAREKLIHSIPPYIIDAYNNVYKVRGHKSIVPLEYGSNDITSCGGCHLIVTQHKESLLHKGVECVKCEHCARILYLPPQSKPTNKSMLSGSKTQK